MLALTLFSLLAAARQIPLLPPESDLSGLRDRLIHVLPEIEALKNIGGTTGMSIGVMSHGNVVLEPWLCRRRAPYCSQLQHDIPRRVSHKGLYRRHDRAVGRRGST